MKNKITITFILTIPALFCFGMIFFLSSQDNIQTNDLSQSFTKKIAEILFKNFSSMSIDVQQIIISELNLFIRKAAHFSIYMLMSIFIYAEIVFWTKKYLLSIASTVGICIILAAMDEFHQSLVPGRTPLSKDVIIDCCGALIGAFICFAIISIISFIKTHREK